MNNMIEIENPSNEVALFDPKYNQLKIKRTNQVLPGPNKIVSRYFPFDSESVAEKCAGKGKYKNQTAQEIIELWNKKANLARKEGINVHEYAKQRFLFPRSSSLIKPLNKRCEGLFQAVDNMKDRLLKWFDFIDVEKVIFSSDLNIMGVVDLILRDRENNEIVFLDWKQNENIKTENSFQKALPPLDHLDHCNYNQYNLVMTIYAKISEHEHYYDTPGYRIGLIHLLANGRAINMSLKPLYPEIKSILGYQDESEKPF